MYNIIDRTARHTTYGPDYPVYMVEGPLVQHNSSMK